MKRIKRRAAAALVLAGLIVIGMGFFLFRLADQGGRWASYRANAHVFNKNGTLISAAVTDRNGVALLHAAEGVYSYAEEESVRLGSLHAVGDRRGYVGGTALSLFGKELTGWSLADGTPGGGTVVPLTLDSRLQSAAWQALAGRPGAVMVLNYETGEILCMVSSPSYDPIRSPDMSVDGLFINRCTGGAFTPGSIFKLVTLVAAYENIPDLEDRTFFCDEVMTMGPDTVTCTGRHGEQTIEQALGNSCNIAFGELALELGGETLRRTALRLGVAGSLPYHSAATAPGRFDTAESGTSLEAWSGIGQYNDLVTPYAMARLCAAIANGGVAAEPCLLLDGSCGRTRIMSGETAAYMDACMNYAAVTHYTWLFPDMDLGAKTGTAELGDGSAHAWFVGYLRSGAPLAFAVLVERGGNGYSVAGAIASAVLQNALEYYEG